MSNVKDIIGLMKNPSSKDVALVTKAFAVAQKAHEGQTRLTGEPYIEHVFETAKTLAQLHMCAESIAAGLLHDTLEDGRLSAEDLKKNSVREFFPDQRGYQVGKTQISRS